MLGNWLPVILVFVGVLLIFGSLTIYDKIAHRLHDDKLRAIVLAMVQQDGWQTTASRITIDQHASRVTVVLSPPGHGNVGITVFSAMSGRRDLQMENVAQIANNIRSRAKSELEILRAQDAEQPLL